MGSSEAGARQTLGGLKLVNLPAGPLAGMLKELIKLGGGFLRRAVRTDVTGVETVTDGQQIHTQRAQRTPQR